MTKATSDTMDTRSNRTFPESEQPGSAAAEGSYTHARRRGSSDLSGDSSRRGDRPRSDLSRRVDPYPRHSSRTPSATGNSAYPAMGASRESKGPPDSYFLGIASDIREFEQQWTTLGAAPTRELHKLNVKVSALVREYSVKPNERTKNGLSYKSVSLLDKDEAEQRSILLELIPSLKAELAGSEFVNFDGLMNKLLGPQRVSHPDPIPEDPDPIPEVAPTIVPEPNLQSTRRRLFKALAAFPGF